MKGGDSMEKSYDVIVVGTGVAGITGAYTCGKAGLRVAIIDERPFGGTCALRGCDPKKLLYTAAEIIRDYLGFGGENVFNGKLEIEWNELMRFKKDYIAGIPEAREKAFREAGIDTYHGKAAFLRRDTILVGEYELVAGKFIIASGSRPADLEIIGDDYVLTSDDFLELDLLPEHVAFIGGGYISMEFAGIARMAGSEVTVIHRGPAILKGFDPDLVELVQKACREMGINIVLNARVRSVEKIKKGFQIASSLPEGERLDEADLVFHGAGRVPNVEGLELEKAGIEVGKSGIVVNDYLQSVSCPHVYAAGDCAASGGPNLTPVSTAEGEIVAKNILNTNTRKYSPAVVPTVVFTLPPLAAVGLTESQAVERKIDFRKNYAETSDWYSSRRLGLNYSGFKVLIENSTGKILGAHLFYPHGEEVINLFALAIANDLTIKDLKKVVYTYPTCSSDIKYML